MHSQGLPFPVLILLIFILHLSFFTLKYITLTLLLKKYSKLCNELRIEKNICLSYYMMECRLFIITLACAYRFLTLILENNVEIK